MNAFKTLLSPIFGIIGLIMSCLSLLIVTPLYFIIFGIMGKHYVHIAHGLSRIWASYILLCYGLRLKVIGKNLLQKNQNYVFISNHRSQLDIPVCARTTSHTFKFLAKEELTKAPLLGYIIKKLYITVRRESLRDKVLALKKMESELLTGISIWVYPEGTRNKTDKPLTEFQDGAFTVAINTGTPIAVFTLYDTAKILKPGQEWKSWPGTVHGFWSEPIETQGLSRKDIPELKAKISEMMTRQIEKQKARE